MKKVFAGLVILLSAVLCLSGCEDNKIDDGLEKQVTEKGKEMMQAWVDENMPGPRPQLEVTADLRLPEDTDLFAYNLAGVKSLCEECGLFSTIWTSPPKTRSFRPSGPGRRQLMKEAGSTRMTSGSGEFRRAE